MKHDLNKLPIIIDALGYYKTRSNNMVVINKIVPASDTDKSDTDNLEFNCIALLYNRNGDIISRKAWHKSGRISQYSISPLDIIEQIDLGENYV